jgi:nicotinate-nucleotide adenylyltransferase
VGGGALGSQALTGTEPTPEAGKRRSLGVMGGTFDPIHLGHLAVAEEAREGLGLDRILFVPAARPPHKLASEVTPIVHRLAMVDLATADNPAFELSRIEVDRPGPSYTVDTIETLASAGDRVIVILSAETFAELPTWHEPARLFEAAHVAVAPRWGYPAPDAAWLAAAFPGREDRVSYLEGPRLGVSSTALRARVAAGRSIRYLVPDRVAAYIAANDLYLQRRPASS